MRDLGTAPERNSSSYATTSAKSPNQKVTMWPVWTDCQAQLHAPLVRPAAASISTFTRWFSTTTESTVPRTSTQTRARQLLARDSPTLSDTDFARQKTGSHRDFHEKAATCQSGRAQKSSEVDF